MKNNSDDIKNLLIVSHEEWLTARKALLAREKEFTRLRDELSRQRRALPWEKVDKQYVFEGPDGQQTLADLFEQRSQLIVGAASFFAPGSLQTTKVRSISIVPNTSSLSLAVHLLATPIRTEHF